MRRFGLTLIELILVIGIIAVLFALLVPSLQRSRLQAKAVVCMSNIRQLNTVFSMYVTDSGKFPYGFDNPPAGTSGRWLCRQYSTMIELGGGGLITSRTFIRKIWLGKPCFNAHPNNYNRPTLKDDILCGNYGVNLSICRMSTGNADQNEFVGKPRCCSDIFRPAQTLLIVDSGYAIISWRHAADVPPVTLGNTQHRRYCLYSGLVDKSPKTAFAGTEDRCFIWETSPNDGQRWIC